jgi:glycosyltransferase involved in cell wall biosynthesis
LIAVKPYLASFGAGLLAAERRRVPLILDIDDLDVALAPLAVETRKPARTDLDRPDSEIYLSLLTRAAPAASAITVASTALQKRFGGTLVPHGSLTDLFEPDAIDRDEARRLYKFSGPTVLFPGTPRKHKGIRPLAKAVAKVAGARLAVLCRPEDMARPEWDLCQVQRIPLVPYASLPALLAAADVVAIPQLDKAPSRYQMPMKVYDCMAMGKPIVASTMSDLPATLDGCASLVPPGDVERLAAAIADLLQNPAKARALGEKARARCLERFSMPKIAEILREVVLRVLDRK